MSVILVDKFNICLCKQGMKCVVTGKDSIKCLTKHINEAGYQTVKVEGEIDINPNTILQQKGKGWYKK